MGRSRGPIALFLFATLLAGASSCEPELVAPKGGYLVVNNVFSPVRIHTSRLEGAGRLEALSPDGVWTLIHFEPNGAFIYDQPLPGEMWHCSNPGGTEGCVARLRVAHDEGPVGFNAAFGTGIVHVCTANYEQRQGRKHCGARELERLSGALDDDVWLPAAKSLAAEQNIAALDEGTFVWRGDSWNRLLWGTHDFKHTDADSPPTGASAEELSGTFFDYAWDPDAPEISIDLGKPSHAHWKAYSMDLGACSFFIPWEWAHRLDGAYYTAGLGASLDDRGLAERFIDEMVDTGEPLEQTEVNALLWIDATAGIVPNESASPEFHYRLSEDAGQPQICFKQYFHASSDLSAKPDHWYRFDQAIGAFFLELLPFIGQCGSKNVSFRYCGTPKVAAGVGTFEIDQSSVQIAHQGYPWAKTICNNQFVPQFIDGVRQTFAPGGEGAKQIDSGIALLVETLGDVLGLAVRRIEISPRGMYLVTAESTGDPQYGLGDCRPDLDRKPMLPNASRPTETRIEYQTRGITRF
jgi:hypothetical protein